MKRPFCCPVCKGSRCMTAGFYADIGPMDTGLSCACRSCVNGIAWGDDGEAGCTANVEPTKPIAPVQDALEIPSGVVTTSWIPYDEGITVTYPLDPNIQIWNAPNTGSLSQYTARFNSVVQGAQGN